MKAVVNTTPDVLELQELPLPKPGPGQVRIRTAACGICATDIEMIRGWERTGFPAIPGHEWAGIVDAVGSDADKTLIGKKCVAENVLDGGGEVGFEHPGGYAEFFLTQADKVQELPDSFDMTSAALIEPLAVCVRALHRLRVDFTAPLLIFGDGPIGLLTLLLLDNQKLNNTLIIGGREQRLALARKFGAGHTLNYHTVKDLNAAIHKIGFDKFPTIIEASGSQNAMDLAFNNVEKCGRILLVGDYGNSRADFLWNKILHTEIELIGTNASQDAWPEAVRQAVMKKDMLENLITHKIPIQNFPDGINLIKSRQPDVIKVVLLWGEV
ncbi:MAG: zinc-dependent alcohol dehydrogenase [Sedimentisphaerales bacterium]